MRIAMIVEGDTERAFVPHLRRFLETQLKGRMPKLDVLPYHGRIPKGEKLRRMVERLLENRQKQPADAVIAVTDVYTGGLSPDFADASVAKAIMREWVGDNPRFHPHAAQHDFEAWLLPLLERHPTTCRKQSVKPWFPPGTGQSYKAARTSPEGRLSNRASPKSVHQDSRCQSHSTRQ